MDREHDHEVVREHGEHTSLDQQDSTELTTAKEAVGIRQPPLVVVTTPSGRISFLVNLN